MAGAGLAGKEGRCGGCDLDFRPLLTVADRLVPVGAHYLKPPRDPLGISGGSLEALAPAWRQEARIRLDLAIIACSITAGAGKACTAVERVY